MHDDRPAECPAIDRLEMPIAVTSFATDRHRDQRFADLGGMPFLRACGAAGRGAS